MTIKSEDDGSEVIEFKPYQYYEQQVVRRIHHFYISQAFIDPVHYIDMIHRIRSAGPEDIVHLHLNTPGGHLDTGIQLINAMRSSEAHIVCSLEGEAHSLGTLIFLAADEFIVHDNCIMMFHNYSGGVWGKGNEQVARLEATIKWFNELAWTLYIPFLDEDELERILRGEDLWMQTGEIRERLTNMVAIMERAMQEAEEEAIAEEKRAKRAAKKKAAPKKKAAAKKKTAPKKKKPAVTETPPDDASA